MSKKTQWILILVILVVVIIATIAWCAPGAVQIVKELARLLVARDHAGLTAYVHSFGWEGMVILFVLQMIQTIIPYPEILLQIAAGAIYGTTIGTLILMTSYSLAQLVIFYLLRRGHVQLPAGLNKYAPIQKCNRLLHDTDPQTVVFILYLFPFLSNCFVPFLAAQTQISYRRFAGTMIIASLPLMVVSVYLGDRLVAQDWLMAGAAFVVGVVASIILYFGQNKFIAWISARRRASDNA